MNYSRSSNHTKYRATCDFIVSIGSLGISYNQLQNNNVILSLGVGVAAVTFGLMGLTELYPPDNPNN